MIISNDDLTGIQTRMHYSEHDDSYVVEKRMNTRAAREIIEGNKASFASYRKASDPHGEWGDFIGRIPLNVGADLIESGIFYDDDALLRWLQDPANRDFRRRPGRYV